MLSWTDRGLMHGLGLFETILAVDGRPKFLDRHLSRLNGAMERLGWPPLAMDLRSAMVELLQRNQLVDGRARLRLAVTAGSGGLADAAPGADRCVWMSATALANPQVACSVMVSPWRRNEHSPLAGLKCASYAENLLALQKAVSRGFDEVLFLNTAGFLCEAATANVFLVSDGRLLTPDCGSGCLPGVARSLILEVAGDLGIEAVEDALTLEDLRSAEEMFLTSATRGVLPVTRLDEKPLALGPLSIKISSAWHARVLANS